MDIYHIWCNLQPGVSDTAFADSVTAYLDHHCEAERLASYRITRCKLGLRPDALREFHIMLEFENLTQLDAAFNATAARIDPVEGFHQAVDSKVCDVLFALYRDFPDPGRRTGQERF